MDISKASNFERFIYLLLDKDTSKVNALFNDVRTGKGFDLKDKLSDINGKFGFVSGKSTHADRLDTIKKYTLRRADLSTRTQPMASRWH